MKKLFILTALASGLAVMPTTQGRAHFISSVPLPTTEESALYFVADKAAAQSFIETMGQRAIGFLSNDALSQNQKEAEFRKLLQSSFDMTTIGRFALGSYWRSATPAQQKEYLRLFENMVVDVYAQRFNDYQGQKFEISGARPDGDKDTLVSSYIVPDAGSKIKVDWRVRNKNGKNKIIDVIVEGVSMAMTQRSDFSSVIQRGGGKIDVLIDYLKKQPKTTAAGS